MASIFSVQFRTVAARLYVVIIYDRPRIVIIMSIRSFTKTRIWIVHRRSYAGGGCTVPKEWIVICHISKM